MASLVVVSVLTSACILLGSFVLRKTSRNVPIVNEELEKFYLVSTEQPTLQTKQLLEAAKYTVKNLEKYAQESDIISNLYHERILSDEFFEQFKNIEQNLIVEKTIIENEAEMIKPGLKDQIFLEAKKRISGINNQNEPTLFENVAFLKKQDLLQKNFKNIHEVK